MKKFKNWFSSLSETRKQIVVAVLVISTFGLAGTSIVGAIAQSSFNPTPPTAASANPSQAKPASPSPKVEVKTVTTTDSIPFASTTVNDNTLPKGTTRVRTAGVNGVLTHTVQVTYTNGVETNRGKSVDTITTQPINEVTAVGTYVAPAPPAPQTSDNSSTPSSSCPNGTYVNTAGNTVCSPYASSSAPAGATAQCTDGTYSFSQHRQGTCSSHGGVASWL